MADVMSEQTKVLMILSGKEEAATPGELAAELRTSEANIRTYLSRLKKKGFAEGSGQQWYITEAGRKLLEAGEKVPTTAEDVGEDELSRFKYFGQLAAVEPNLIQACVELFQNLDMRSMDDFDRAMAEQNIPQTNRSRWRSNYLGYLRNTTPPERMEELYPIRPTSTEATQGGEGAAVAAERLGEPGLDFVVEGNEVLRVYPGLGMFNFREALQVVAAKRGTGPKGDIEGGLGGILSAFSTALKNANPQQPLTVKDVLDIVDKIAPKPGQGGATPAGYLDEEGWHEVKAGQPVVIVRKEGQPPPSKTLVVKQTPEGIVTEEHTAGSPIIVNVPSSGSNAPPMLMPAFTADGKPITDDKGNPVYAPAEMQMKWLGFQADQRRADEKMEMVRGVVQTVRENVLGDGVAALITASEEIVRRRAAQTAGHRGEESPQPLYECAECHTRFGLTTTEFDKVPCPGCGHEYTREELLGA